MHWIDWLIVLVPILIICFAAFKSQKYTTGVADFLSAGRLAGRYVVCISSGEANFGLISAVAIFEVYYSSGFSYSFWSNLSIPVSLVLGLVGFCNYRFRETKAMTMGQFFELRYSRGFRILAAVIQAISGVINYAIFPAVGARFLIYFLNLPLAIPFFGLQLPTFGLVMLAFLSLALFITLAGGQVTIMVTDCLQGLISYPLYVFLIGYVLIRYSWAKDLEPVLVPRGPGESFLNPYDIGNLRNFNLFYVFFGIVNLFLNRISWGGAMGYQGAAKSAHEAKMGSLLGSWRGSLTTMMLILMALISYVVLNGQPHAEKARRIRTELATKTVQDLHQRDLLPEAQYQVLLTQIPQVPARTKFSRSYATSEEFHAEMADPYTALVKDVTAIGSDSQEERGKGAAAAQQFVTIYNQMTVPVALREILPIGLTGVFCALMIFSLVSTDTTYMHSWGSVIVQDFIMPLRKKPFTPKEQLRALRIAIACVCAFAFFFSYFFAQMDYILMFFAITGAIWAGASIVITLGLYWRRGTTAGAYVALIVGALLASGTIVVQSYWPDVIYPWIEANGWVEAWDHTLRALSKPFNPYIVWQMDAHKFPINSAEVAFLDTLTTIILYVGVSLLTCREPFNMERMLHRGIYSESGKEIVKEPFHLWPFIRRNLLGITEEYSFGDKCLAWSVFMYSFGLYFVVYFLAVIVWNSFSRWPIEAWGWYFFIKQIVVAATISIVTSFWFGICGTRDLFRLFRDLRAKKENDLDNGSVVGNVSAADLEAVKIAESRAKK